MKEIVKKKKKKKHYKELITSRFYKSSAISTYR